MKLVAVVTAALFTTLAYGSHAGITIPTISLLLPNMLLKVRECNFWAFLRILWRKLCDINSHVNIASQCYCFYN